MSLSDSSDSESSGSDQNQDQEPNQSLPSSIEDDNPDDENFDLRYANRYHVTKDPGMVEAIKKVKKLERSWFKWGLWKTPTHINYCLLHCI
jgi:hypothetical protein